MDYEMNNNKLNYIVDNLRQYAKNYVANNPNWDQPTLLKKIESRAKMEAEDFKIKLSQDELSSIKKIAIRGLEGEMEDATSFEDKKEWTDWLSKRKKNKEIIYAKWSAYRFLLSSQPNWTEGENGTLSKLDLNTERILSKLADP